MIIHIAKPERYALFIPTYNMHEMRVDSQLYKNAYARN